MVVGYAYGGFRASATGKDVRDNLVVPLEPAERDDDAVVGTDHQGLHLSQLARWRPDVEVGEVQARYVKAFHRREQRWKRVLLVSILPAGAGAGVPCERVMDGLVDADVAADVLKGVSEAVEHLALVGDADLPAEVAREEVAEITAKLISGIGLQAGK